MKKKLLILVAFCLIISAPIQKTSAQDTEQEVMNIDNNGLEENSEKKLNSEEKVEVKKNNADYKSSEKDKIVEKKLTEDTNKPTVESVEEKEKLDVEENSKELETLEKIEKDNLKKNNYELAPRVGKEVLVENHTEFKNAFNDANVTKIKIAKTSSGMQFAPGQLKRENAQPLTIDISESSISIQNTDSSLPGPGITLINSDLKFIEGRNTSAYFYDYHTIYQVTNSQLTLPKTLVRYGKVRPVIVSGSVRGQLGMGQLIVRSTENNIPVSDRSLFEIQGSSQNPLTVKIDELQPQFEGDSGDKTHHWDSVFDFSGLDRNTDIHINTVGYNPNVGFRTYLKANGNNINFLIGDSVSVDRKPESILENVGDVYFVGTNNLSRFSGEGGPLVINKNGIKSKVKLENIKFTLKDYDITDFDTLETKIDKDISKLDIQESTFTINQNGRRRNTLKIPEINIIKDSKFVLEDETFSHIARDQPVPEYLIKTNKLNVDQSEIILNNPAVKRGVFNVDLENNTSSITNTTIKIHGVIDRFIASDKEKIFDDVGTVFSFSSPPTQQRTVNFKGVSIEHKNNNRYDRKSKVGLFEAEQGDVVINFNETVVDYNVYRFQNILRAKDNAKLTLKMTGSVMKFNSVPGVTGTQIYPKKPFMGGNHLSFELNQDSSVEINEENGKIMSSKDVSEVNTFELQANKGTKFKIKGGERRLLYPLFENVILNYNVDQPEDVDIQHYDVKGPIFQLANGNRSKINVKNSNFESWDYKNAPPDHNNAPYEYPSKLGYGGSHRNLSLTGNNFESITEEGNLYARMLGKLKQRDGEWNPVLNKSRIRSYNPTPVIKGLFPIQNTHRYIYAKIEVPIDEMNPNSHMRPAYTGEVTGVISEKDKKGNITMYEGLETQSDYLEVIPSTHPNFFRHRIYEKNRQSYESDVMAYGTLRADLKGTSEEMVLANLNNIYTIESAKNIVGKEAKLDIDTDLYQLSSKPTKNTPPKPVRVEKAFEHLNYITGKVGSLDTTKIEVYEGIYPEGEENMTLIETIELEENQENFVFYLPNRDLRLGEKFTIVAYNEVRGNPLVPKFWHDDRFEEATQVEVVENPYAYDGNHKAFYIDEFQLTTLEAVAEEIGLKVIEKATNQEVENIELENRDALNFSDIKPGLYSFRAKLFDEDGDVYYSPIYKILIYDQKKVKEVGKDLLIADDFHGNTKTHEIREEKLLKEKARAYAFNLDTGFLQELIFERTKLNEFKENGAEPDEYDLRVKHPDQDTFYLDIKAYIYDYDYVVETVDNLLLANDFVGYAHELPPVINDDYILTMSSAEGYSKNRNGSLKLEVVEVVDHNVGRAVGNYKAHLRVKKTE